MFHLNLQEKVYLVIGCTGLITLTGLAVICYLEYVKWRDRKAQDPTTWPETVQLRHFRLPSDGSSVGRSDSFRSSRDSGRHSVDSPEPLSIDSRKSSIQSQVHQPQVNLSVKFEADSNQLTVNIENAVDLPGRIYTDRRDASVIVRLERRRWSLAGSLGLNDGRQAAQLLAQSASPPQGQHSLHPIFKHTAVFHIDHLSLRDCHIAVTVVDNDKLTGGSEVGHMWMGLCEALEADGPCDEPHPDAVQLCRPLSPPESVEKGDILVSISFLPTSQRILIQVDQCRHLSAVASTTHDVHCLVRLYLLDPFGRVCKRRKTSARPYSSQIRFDESFHFDVTVDKWDRSAILIVVNRVTDEGGSVVCQPSGHAALGKYVTTHAGQIQWNSAFQNPRKLISLWHCLH